MKAYRTLLTLMAGTALTLLPGCRTPSLSSHEELARAHQEIRRAFIDSPNPAQQISEPHYTEQSLISRVENAFSKHDPWVLEWVQQDYTGASPLKPVRLGVQPLEEIKVLGALGSAGHHAFFSPTLRQLVYAETETPEDEKRTTESTHHELSHLVFGLLIDHPDYSGPKKEDIITHVTQKTKGKDFENLRRKITAAIQVENLKTFLPKFGTYVTLLSTVRQTYTKIQDKFKRFADDELEQYLTPEERNTLTVARETFATRYSALQAANSEYARVFEKDIKPLSTQFDATKEDPDLEVLTRFCWLLFDSFKRFEPFADVPQEMNALRTLATTTFNTATERKCSKQIKDLEAQAAAAPTPELRAEFEDAIKMSRDLYGMLRLSQEPESVNDSFSRLETSFSSFTANTRTILTSLVSGDNTSKIDAILNNPDEALARMVAAAFVLHFGPVTQDYYPLTPADETFLGSFTFRGAPLYGKQLRRHALARRMITNGRDPADVQRQLSDATSFTYNGETFSFPALPFTLHGGIPSFRTFSGTREELEEVRKHLEALHNLQDEKNN